MSKTIDVKVNLLEFTYRDKKGYHTVVGYGKVPPDNQDVQDALDKGWLTRVEPVKSTKPKDAKQTPRGSSRKNKEA